MVKSNASKYNSLGITKGMLFTPFVVLSFLSKILFMEINHKNVTRRRPGSPKYFKEMQLNIRKLMSSISRPNGQKGGILKKSVQDFH